MQRDVDHLADSDLIARAQRQQDADHAMQRRQRIADGDAHAHRRAARLAAQVTQAAHGFADGAETRQVAIGAGLAIARDAQHHQPGLMARKVSQPSSQPSSVPGLKFSITTSTSLTRVRIRSCASGWRRSRLTDFLLRD